MIIVFNLKEEGNRRSALFDSRPSSPRDMRSTPRYGPTGNYLNIGLKSSRTLIQSGMTPARQTDIARRKTKNLKNVRRSIKNHNFCRRIRNLNCD